MISIERNFDASKHQKNSATRERVAEALAEVEAGRFTYSVYETPRPVRKELSLEKGKVITKGINAKLTGSAVKNVTETLGGLKDRIIGSEDNFCLSLGVTHKNGVPIGTTETKKTTYRVDYKSEAEKYDITVSRSKNHLWRISGNPSPICFDIDERFETEEEILGLLYQIDPQLEHAEMLIVHSSKSMLFDEEGNQLYGPRLHIYCVINDGGRVKEYLEYLRIRMWDEGLGHIKVNAAGGLLVRSVIDETVFADERIFFESPAKLGEGLVSKAPEPRIIQGGMINV